MFLISRTQLNLCCLQLRNGLAAGTLRNFHFFDVTCFESQTNEVRSRNLGNYNNQFKNNINNYFAVKSKKAKDYQ